MEWQEIIETLIEFIAYVFWVYYLYISVCCIWYVVEFIKRDPLDCLSLPDELMHRLTFGLLK